MRPLCQPFCGLLPLWQADQSTLDRTQQIRNSLSGLDATLVTVFFDDYFIPRHLPGIQLKLFISDELRQLRGAFNIVILNEKDWTCQSFHTLSFQHWQSAPIISKTYKILKLNAKEPPLIRRLATINLQANDVDDDHAMIVEQVSSYRPLLSLTTLLERNQSKSVPTEGHLRHYLQMLWDLNLVERYFRGSALLRGKTLRYYDRYCRASENYSHSETMLYFLSRLLSSQLQGEIFHPELLPESENVYYLESGQMNDAIGLFDEWLTAESLLFKRYATTRPDDLLSEFELSLQRHVSFMNDTLSPLWFQWQLRAGNFWLRNGERYSFSIEFLLMPTLSAHFHSESSKSRSYCHIERGVVTVEPMDFFEVVLPQFYRLMLSDVFAYLLDVHRDPHYHFHTIERIRRRHLVDNDTELRLTRLFELIRHEKSKKKHCNNSLVYRCAFAEGDFSSPVMKRLLQRKTTRQAQHVADLERVILPKREIARDTVGDIEDLFVSARMAPCMRHLLQAKWMRNMDRVNTVRYLLDLKFTREEIVKFLCRHEPHNKEHVNEVAAQYDFYEKKKRREKAPDENASFGCSSIIQLRPQNGEQLRCVFEARASGQKRRYNYTMSEKQVFMSECCASRKAGNRRQEIRHPVDHLFIVQ